MRFQTGSLDPRVRERLKKAIKGVSNLTQHDRDRILHEIFTAHLVQDHKWNTDAVRRYFPQFSDAHNK